MNRKLNRTVKVILGVFLSMVAGTAIYKLVVKKSDCSFADENLKDNRFYANIRGQNIHVVGWYHGTIERDVAQLAMAAAIDNGKNGNCGLAQKQIESALARLRDQKIESERVLATLSEIYNKRHFQSLGVEYGVEQYRDEFVDPETNQDLSTEFITIFKNFCSDQVERFSDLYLVFPGPEYRFVLDKRGRVKTVPLGSDALIKKSFSALSNESRLFAQKVDQLSPPGRAAYGHFVEMTKHGQSPQFSKLLELTVDLREPEKSIVEKYFKEVSVILGLMEERDNYFVDEILKTRSDIAVVIGSFHVSGLRKKLETQCNSGDR